MIREGDRWGRQEECFFRQRTWDYVKDLAMGLWCVLAKPRTHAGQHGQWKAAWEDTEGWSVRFSGLFYEAGEESL